MRGGDAQSPREQTTTALAYSSERDDARMRDAVSRAARKRDARVYTLSRLQIAIEDIARERGELLRVIENCCNDGSLQVARRALERFYL
jgi:hypothetical protein